MALPGLLGFTLGSAPSEQASRSARVGGVGHFDLSSVAKTPALRLRGAYAGVLDWQRVQQMTMAEDGSPNADEAFFLRYRRRGDGDVADGGSHGGGNWRVLLVRGAPSCTIELFSSDLSRQVGIGLPPSRCISVRRAADRPEFDELSAR
jgi:hypothetical protein